MKRFSRMFAVLVAVVITLSALAVGSFADSKPTLENDNVINDWSGDNVARVYRNISGNQTKGTLTPDGLFLEYTGGPDDGADPFFTFQIGNYYKQFTNDCPTPENAAYIVFKIKANAECDGSFEVFTSQPAAFDNGSADYYSDGEWQYILVDMYLTTLVEEAKLTSIRIDWSANNTAPGATMTIGEVAFFPDEDAAYAYIDAAYEKLDPNYQPPTEAPTEAPTAAPTEAPTAAPTEAPTEAATTPETATEAPTEAEPAGCIGVMACGTAAIVLTAAAAVAVKKKH